MVKTRCMVLGSQNREISVQGKNNLSLL